MSSEKSGFGSFLLGGVVGAVVGILFAPQAGAETRAVLKEKAQAYLDNADVVNDSVRDKAVELYSVASGRAGEASGQLKDKIDTARARLTETVNTAADSAAAALASAKSAVADTVNAVTGSGDAESTDSADAVADTGDAPTPGKA